MHKERNNTLIIILGIIFILLLVFIFSQKGNKENEYQNIVLKNKITNLENELNSFKEEKRNNSVKQEEIQESQITENTENETEETNTINETNEWQGSTTIKIPGLQLDGENYKIVYVEKNIPQTKSVLKASYHELFKKEGGNSGTWNGFQFSSVDINNGLATVKLTGSWRPAGTMSKYFFVRLIDATAFQYPNITDVHVIVNGNLFDLCIDDQSEGEGKCADAPIYWFHSRTDFLQGKVL